jgi:integrase/recombinase XerD
MRKQQYTKHHLGHLKLYLNERYTAQTSDGYYRVIAQYLELFPEAKNAQKTQIVDYINTLREHYKNPGSINRMVHAIKAYYSFLKHTGQITYHPLKTFVTKDKQTREIQLQDLFSAEELQALFTRKERYQNVAIRNKVLLGLLVYQALRADELERLRVQDVDLERAQIHVRKTRLSSERKLPLEPQQIMAFHQYIHNVRPLLLRGKTSDILLINKLGNPDTVSSLSGFFKVAYKGWYSPRKINLTTIRQSVITNLLKQGKELRSVQVFAGHKYPSTTERYKPPQTEHLRAKIKQLHPLNMTEIKK